MSQDAQASSFPAIHAASYPRTYAEYKEETPCTMYFDLFMRCSGMSGRLQDYYRHGSFSFGRNCSVYSDELWFCLRQRLYAPEQQEDHFEKRRMELLQSPEHAKLQADLEAIWKKRQ